MSNGKKEIKKFEDLKLEKKKKFLNLQISLLDLHDLYLSNVLTEAEMNRRKYPLIDEIILTLDQLKKLNHPDFMSDQDKFLINLKLCLDVDLFNEAEFLKIKQRIGY